MWWLLLSGLATNPSSFEVTDLLIDTGGSDGVLDKFWQASVGSGHATLGLRPDWQNQLKVPPPPPRRRRLLGTRTMRCSLFCSWVHINCASIWDPMLQHK